MRGKQLPYRVTVLEGRIIPARAGQTGDTASQRQSSTDHPRACGANVLAAVPVGATTGSSPRVRGKQFQAFQIHVIRRIIPARAGQTRSATTSRHPSTDHPRACGANRLISVAAACRAGSSPRVRGKLNAVLNLVQGIRIIPARAGQTTRYMAPPLSPPDHPRACGANPIDGGEMLNASGSSPRVRGKRYGWLRS